MRKISFLLCIILILSVFAGCNKNKENNTEPLQGCELLVYADTSASVLPFIKLYDDSEGGKLENTYDLIVGNANDNMMEIILGRYDIALLPTPRAFELYNKSEMGAYFVGVSEYAEIYIVSNIGEIASFDELMGKTVYIIENGDVVYSVFNYLCSEASLDVTIEIVADYNELIEKFVAEEEFICVTDNRNSYNLMKDLDLPKTFDVSEYWNTTYGYDIPSEIIVANKKFATVNPGAIHFLKEEYLNAVDFCKESGYSSDEFDVIIYEDDLNNITFITENEMKEALNDFAKRTLKFDIREDCYVENINNVYYEK